MENDLRAKEALMEQGVFSQPMPNGGMSRVACKDIALAVVKALEDRGRVWDRKKIMLGSGQTYSVSLNPTHSRKLK